MTSEPEIVSIKQIGLRNGKPKENSIKQRVFALLNMNPDLTAKPLCGKLGLPYPKYEAYVCDLRKKWKKVPKKSMSSTEFVAPQEPKSIIKRSCLNCGWKLHKHPVIVELYGIERVDYKTMVNRGKWCVQWAERPTVCPCGEWVPKQ